MICTTSTAEYYNKYFFMKTNMSSFDRVIRILIAAACIFLYTFNIVPATVGIVLLVVAIIFLLTSIVGFCPLYKLLGISSRKQYSQE